MPPAQIALASHRSAQYRHHVFHRGIDVFRFDGEVHAGVEVVLDNHEFHLTHRGDDGICLLNFIEAVAAIFNHLLDAAHLSLDFFQTVDDPRFFLRRACHKNTAVTKLVFHLPRYTPTEYEIWW